jgi:hypothetical protein
MNHGLRPALFLIIVTFLAVGALLQAFHDEAFAIPACSTVCVCTNPPCGGPPVQNKLCGGLGCGGVGTVHSCEEYCPIT